MRSIQKHDDDFDWAAEGDRVGLALKNIESDDLDRGFVLSSVPRSRHGRTLKHRRPWSNTGRHPSRRGRCSTSGTGCSSSRFGWSGAGRRNWRRPTLTLALEKDLVYLPGDTAVLHYLEGGKLRIAGHNELASTTPANAGGLLQGPLRGTGQQFTVCEG